MLKILLASAVAALGTGSLLAEVSYSTFNYPEADGGATYLTGIRKDGDTGGVYITGVYTPAGGGGTQGLLYRGSITENTGAWSLLNFTSTPEANVTSTALYSPNDLGGGIVRAVGSYKTEETGARDIGLIYEGAMDGSGTWQTLDATELNSNTLNTIAHSTHGGLVVGNYDTSILEGKAFIFDIGAGQWVDFNPIGATSITAYGIWHNGGTSYTIAGGFSLNPTPETLDQGYLVDWDSETRTASNFKAYNFNNAPLLDGVSHFDGITSDGKGGYNLTGDYIGVGAENGIAFFASVSRTELGFSEASWTQISYPSSEGLAVNVTSGNSVYENYVIGIYTANGEGVAQGYVAAVPEPGSVVLLLAAGGAALALRKRRP